MKSEIIFDKFKYQGQALICFTYDDGLLDNYELAVPSHIKYGVPATFAIIANRVIDPSFHDKFVSVEQMQDMARMGFEISSHGFYHREKFTELNTDGLDRELNLSKKVLNALLDENKVETICIPYGVSDEHVISEAYKHYDIVRLYGYRGFSLDKVKNRIPLDAYPVLNSTTSEKIIEWIENAIESKKVIVLMLHGIAKDPTNKGDYYFSHQKLDEILEYVSMVESSKLLPICMKNLLSLEEN